MANISIVSRRHLRLSGINCPELHADDLVDRENAVKAKELSKTICPPGPCMVEITGTEKYGRWLGNVANMAGTDVATWLLADGLAKKVKYAGVEQWES